MLVSWRRCSSRRTDWEPHGKRASVEASPIGRQSFDSIDAFGIRCCLLKRKRIVPRSDVGTREDCRRRWVTAEKTHLRAIASRTEPPDPPAPVCVYGTYPAPLTTLAGHPTPHTIETPDYTTNAEE